MANLRELRAVDDRYATTGPNHHQIRQPMAVAASVVFDSFSDPAAWKAGIGIDVEWTSEPPFGVGTTRTVRGAAGLVIEEQFLVWEAGRRINFRFTRASLPVAAFAEDYLVEPKGDDACELVWSYAYEWAGPLGGVTGFPFKQFFAWNGRRGLAKWAKWLEGQ